MIKLCESCYRQVDASEPHAVLRALYKMTAAGRPEWRDIYLHRFDPAIGNCTTVSNSDAAAR